MTKRILITGKNSYIGNQLADWLKKEPAEYEVIKESVRVEIAKKAKVKKVKQFIFLS